MRIKPGVLSFVLLTLLVCALSPRFVFAQTPAPSPACTPADGFPEGFDDFDIGVRPPGWEFIGIGSGDVFTSPGDFGEASPSLRFSDVGDRVVSRQFANPLTMSFWIKGLSTSPSTVFLVEEYGAGGWQPVVQIEDPPDAGSLLGPYPLNLDSTRIRFTYQQVDGEIAFDDVTVCRAAITPPPAATPTPPARLEVTPAQLSVNLPIGGSAVRELLLENTGWAPLNHAITFRVYAPTPAETPTPSPTPVDYQPSPTPEDYEPTPTPEDYEPTPTPDPEPEPTPAVFTLTISVDGEGSTDPMPGSYEYDEGTIVPLSAWTDEPGVFFDEWVVDPDGTFEEADIEIEMDANKTATAYFLEFDSAGLSGSPGKDLGAWHEGIVRIKVSPAARDQARVSVDDSGVGTLGVATLDALNRKFSATNIRMVFPTDPRHAERHRRWGLDRWFEIRFDKAPRVSEVVSAYRADTNVEIAEPIYRKRLHWLPDDPRFGEQWHYRNTGQTGGTPGADIRLEEAWEIERGDPSVIVCVVDSGIDVNHPDLIPNLWINPDPDPVKNDIHGWNFANDNANIQDTDGHGTHVAGTVAAVTNNALGVAGVAGGSGTGDGARIMVARVFGDGAVVDGFPEAIVYGADNGAVISQNSWGYIFPGVYEEAVLEAIDYFIAEAGDYPGSPLQGGVVVFAAGNDDDDGQWYPAYHEPVISVAATDHNDQKAWYSNYGGWVDISAPGGNTIVATNQGVLSTLVDGYGFLQGTSMAAPHVSGVAALLASSHPGVTNSMIKSALINSADNIDPVNPAYAGLMGSGRLNAYRALRALVDLDWIGAEPLSGTIPPGGQETVQVFFDAEDYLPGTYSAEIVISSNDPVDPKVIVPAVMNVLPPPSPTPAPPLVGPISGHVYDSRTFQGIPNIRVTASGLDGLRAAGYADTDSNGFYRIESLKRGNYEIEAVPRHGSPYRRRKYIHPVPTGSTDINIMLPRVDHGDISGRVFDRDTGAGLADFRVYARGLDGVSDADFADTDAAGNYRLENLKPGYYELVAQPKGPTFIAEYAPLKLEVPVYIDTSGVDFAMPKGGAIYGRVYDELTGEGVPDINIVGWDMTVDRKATARTDAGGYYRVSPLSAGRHFLEARAEFHNLRHESCYSNQWYYQRHWVGYVEDEDGRQDTGPRYRARDMSDRIKLGPGQEVRKDLIMRRCPVTTPTPEPVLTPSPTPAGEIEIWQIWGGSPMHPDSGGGQATLILNPVSGVSAMYDCGDYLFGSAGSPSLPREALYLMNQLGMSRGDLDYLIISHYDWDHNMGVPFLVDGTGDPADLEFVREGIGPPAVATYDRGGSIRATRDRGDPHDPGFYVHPDYLAAVGASRQTWWVGGEIDLGMPGADAIIKCLAIGSALDAPGDPEYVYVYNRPDITTGTMDENALSLVVNLMYGGFDMYMGGDSTSELGGYAAVEEAVGDVIRNDLNRGMDVLLVNHHGSAHHTSSRFLNLLNPSLAIIPIWRGPYNFPREAVFERLSQVLDCEEGRQVILQTSDAERVADVCGFSARGHIHVRTDGNFYTVETYEVEGRTVQMRELTDEQLIDHPVNPVPQPTPEPEEFNVVLSQVATEGPGGANDMFVEIYNPRPYDLDVGGWQLQYNPASASGWGINRTIPVGTTLPSYYYLLFTHPTWYTGPVPGDLPMHPTQSVAATGGHLRLIDNVGEEHDRIGWMGAVEPEGEAVPSRHWRGGSYLRKVTRFSTAASLMGDEYGYGNLFDSDNNLFDFVVMDPDDGFPFRRPRNLAAGPYPPPPGPSPTPYVNLYREWNLPAGGTHIGGKHFDQYLLIYNLVGGTPAQVAIEFVGENGLLTSINRTVAPLSRLTVKVNDHVGNFQPAVSTFVRVKNEVDVICERSMYWSPDGVRWGGGHNSIGIARAENKWYLAEGSTANFDQFVHVLNSNFTPVDVEATFVNEKGRVWTVTRTVPARSNWTIDVRDVVGRQAQVSARISAPLPIAVDRTMYWDSNGVRWIDGHASRGAPAPRVSWHLPEGATHIFDEYVLAANFSDRPSRVRFTFMDKYGDTTFHTRTVDPLSRYTVRVSDFVGRTDQVSTIVSSDNEVPIVAERAMYWQAGGVPWAGGHASVGALRPAVKWYLPEGATHVFDQYILVANPSRSLTAEVDVIFSDAFGNSWVHPIVLEPLSRKTVKAASVIGVSTQVATVVESSNLVPVIAERAMYWNAGGVRWASGHATIGFSGL